MAHRGPSSTHTLPTLQFWHLPDPHEHPATFLPLREQSARLNSTWLTKVYTGETLYSLLLFYNQRVGKACLVSKMYSRQNTVTVFLLLYPDAC